MSILQPLQLTKWHLTANRVWKCLNPTTSPAVLVDLLIVCSIVRSTALPPGNSTVSTHCHSMPCRTGSFFRDHHSSHWFWRHCSVVQIPCKQVCSWPQWRFWMIETLLKPHIGHLAILHQWMAGELLLHQPFKCISHAFIYSHGTVVVGSIHGLIDRFTGRCTIFN